MSLSFDKVIAETEEKHSELLKALAEVENAPEELVAQRKRIAELQAQVEENVSKVDKSKKEKRSTSSAFKLGFLLRRTNSKGKEKEYEASSSSVESVEEADRERERQAELDQSLKEALGERVSLENKVKEYESLKAKLEALYDLIFNGPTPGFPAEDQLEQQVAAAKAVQERVQHALEAEKRAFDCIYKAEKTMRECRSKLKDALQFAATSLFASSRSSEEREASVLHSAQNLARQVQPLIREAQQLSPDVKPLESISLVRELPSRADTRDGDAFYGKVKSAASDIQRVHLMLSDERQAALGRVSTAKAVVESAESTLSQYKKELLALRQTIYQEVAAKMREQMESHQGFTGDEDVEYLDAPPSYEYEPPMMFVPTFSPSPLVIPNKCYRQLPSSYSDPSSPVSSSSQSTFSWTATSPTSTIHSRRPRPLPRPPGT